MKIYINSDSDIIYINENSTNDITLIELDIEREYVFGNMSDYMILNYKYMQTELGFSIMPKRNLNEIIIDDYRIKIDEQGNKISILEAENADLLLDSASKDIKIQTIESDLADLTLEIAMGGM